MADIPFSEELKQRTKQQHGEAEESPFVEELLSGKRTKDDYLRLAQQQYFIYRELEEVAAELKSDPDVAQFVAPELEFCHRVGPRVPYRTQLATAPHAAACHQCLHSTDPPNPRRTPPIHRTPIHSVFGRPVRRPSGTHLAAAAIRIRPLGRCVL